MSLLVPMNHSFNNRNQLWDVTTLPRCKFVWIIDSIEFCEMSLLGPLCHFLDKQNYLWDVATLPRCKFVWIIDSIEFCEMSLLILDAQLLRNSRSIPWGFRMIGGSDHGCAFTVERVIFLSNSSFPVMCMQPLKPLWQLVCPSIYPIVCPSVGQSIHNFL